MNEYIVVSEALDAFESTHPELLKASQLPRDTHVQLIRGVATSALSNFGLSNPMETHRPSPIWD